MKALTLATVLLTATNAHASDWIVPVPQYGQYTPQPLLDPGPEDSYITPMPGGGFRETYPGSGSITVTPNPLGGYNINRSGFLPGSRY